VPRVVQVISRRLLTVVIMQDVYSIVTPIVLRRISGGGQGNPPNLSPDMTYRWQFLLSNKTLSIECYPETSINCVFYVLLLFCIHSLLYCFYIVIFFSFVHFIPCCMCVCDMCVKVHTNLHTYLPNKLQLGDPRANAFD